MVGVIGPSGSGKSTLLRALNRLWELPADSVFLDYNDITQLDVLTLQCRLSSKRKTFAKIENLNWHGPIPDQPQWEDSSSSFLAVSLKPERNENESRSTIGDLYIAFNSEQALVSATLPQLPDGMLWYRLVDTSLPFPETFSMEGRATDMLGISFFAYQMQPHSCVLFEARLSKE